MTQPGTQGMASRRARGLRTRTLPTVKTAALVQPCATRAHRGQPRRCQRCHGAESASPERPEADVAAGDLDAEPAAHGKRESTVLHPSHPRHSWAESSLQRRIAVWRLGGESLGGQTRQSGEACLCSGRNASPRTLNPSAETHVWLSPDAGAGRRRSSQMLGPSRLAIQGKTMDNDT